MKASLTPWLSRSAQADVEPAKIPVIMNIALRILLGLLLLIGFLFLIKFAFRTLGLILFTKHFEQERDQDQEEV